MQNIQKIVLVSHCILNVASKVVMYNEEEMNKEELLRKDFLKKALNSDVQIIQLPCPEFTLYGANRWGHVSNQFNNIFFKNHCREVLKPIINQIQEYLEHPTKFKLLGIVGIDGSPSCGVDYTCYGDWFGSFEGREDLTETLDSCKLAKGSGVFITILRELLKEYNIDNKVKVTSLFADEREKCLAILD